MDDLISRQAAIDAECAVCSIIPPRGRGHNCQYYVKGCPEVECLRNVPSAQPERKKGKWIDRYNNGDWHCSICNAIVEKDEQTYRNWYYCYHCGADMRKENR